MAAPGLGQSNGVAFIVSAGVVYEVVAKACSSPQTTELNAGARAPTLMKWVNIGTAEAAVIIAIGAMIDPTHRNAIIAGGALAAAVTYFEYLHARNAGLRSKAPGTETWSSALGC